MKKIPYRLSRRLNRSKRLEALLFIQRLDNLNRNFLFVLDYLEIFFTAPFRDKPARLFYLHGLATLGALAAFPPPPETPPIAIPIVWAAGFCTAYTLSAFIPS